MSSGLMGVAELRRKLQKHKKKLAQQLSRGLLNAGYLLQRESQKLVPISLGDLRRSAYTRKEGSGFNTVVSVGYELDYALWVHENVLMKWKGKKRRKPFKGVYWGPKGRQAKFLEAPFRERRKELMALIKAGLL